jgi:putative Mg2+ transporter-C (MgtC) family protein
MAAIQAFNGLEFLNSAGNLLLAFFLGTLIGSERQYRQRTAGLRTNVLVAVGAAAFVDLGMRLNENAGAVHVVAYVVSGVGFIGAGVIMKEGTNVRGLNTAATLWSSAAVGAFSGADLLGEATLLTAFILAGNTFLRRLVNFINRIPIDERVGEAAYEMEVTCYAERVSDARELLVQRAEASNYPVGDIDEIARQDNIV